MKQTKLSKQQKKIIMILGESHDESVKLLKKKTYGAKHHKNINVIDLKRKVLNIYYKKRPMTKVEVISTGRSINRLEARGIVKHPTDSPFPNDYFTLTNKEGLCVYRDLKKERKKKRLV